VRSSNDQPILSAIARLAPFAILSFILQNAYHQLDAYFLGQVSSTASNAMGLLMMVSIANFGFILTLARGTQSLVGRRVGAQSPQGAAVALGQGLGLAMRVVVPLAAIQWIFAPEILTALGGSPEVVAAGTRYLRVLYVFMPFLFMSPIQEFAFQSMGDTGTPFRLQCLAVGSNGFLTWLLVFQHDVSLFGGEFTIGGWGVTGAAVSTGISRLLSSGLGFLILRRRAGFEALGSRSQWRMDGRIAREILRVGVPSGSATLLYAVVGMGITAIVARFGQDALGAYYVGFRGIESTSFMIVLGMGVATATVVSHAVGAGDFERARRAAHVGVAAGVAIMLFTTVLFMTLSETLAGFFTVDPGIRAAAAVYIATMAFCQVPQALEMIYSDAMAGAGSTMRTAAISIPGNILRVPLAWFLAVGLGWGLGGVWYAIVASAVLKGAGVTLLFFSRKWEKAMHRGRELLDAT
jgi:putative MATE family efflux protein